MNRKAVLIGAITAGAIILVALAGIIFLGVKGNQLEQHAANLQQKNDTLVADLDELQTENDGLTAANSTLKEQKAEAEYNAKYSSCIWFAYGYMSPVVTTEEAIAYAEDYCTPAEVSTFEVITGAVGS